MERRDAPRENGQPLPDKAYDGGGIDWPDWRNDIVAIIASGPSVKSSNLSPLQGRAKVLAIKETVDLCPWADAVYGCDEPWWTYRKGLPEYHGLKICWAGNRLAGFPEIRRVEIVSPTSTDLEFGTGKIGAGGNSGFQALNLAVNFGATRILLIGFDMTDKYGAHWYGRNMWHRANNPTPPNFQRWKANFAKAADALNKRGIEVVNASGVTALDCFPRHSIEEALRIWE